MDTGAEKSKKELMPTASAVLDDGTLVELVYQPVRRRTFLALYSAGRWTLAERVDPHIPEHFDNPITIVEAEGRFRAAGLPRHPKSIERYCRVGSLRCKKEYGANGFQYLIGPTSADELIEFLKQAHHIRNTPEQGPASSGALRKNQQANSKERGSHTLPPAPAGSDISFKENHEEHAGARAGGAACCSRASLGHHRALCRVRVPELVDELVDEF